MTEGFRLGGWNSGCRTAPALARASGCAFPREGNLLRWSGAGSLASVAAARLVLAVAGMMVAVRRRRFFDVPLVQMGSTGVSPAVASISFAAAVALLALGEADTTSFRPTVLPDFRHHIVPQSELSSATR
jgi:hypothetical protein